MLKKIQISTMAMLLVVAGMAVSCNEDDEPNNSPAHQIKQSEKLTIPAAVAVPAENTVRIATYFAKGVQKYKAQQKAGTSEFEWVFVAPEAVLYDASGEVGTHYAGPSWELNDSNDKIVAQHFAPAKTSSVDAGSIDWLMLKPKDGTTPTGVFTAITYIQRIATKGGKAPATPPASIDQTVDVPYTAIYRFTM